MTRSAGSSNESGRRTGGTAVCAGVGRAGAAGWHRFLVALHHCEGLFGLL